MTDDLDTLRPEVREAMHRLENYLHITIDGKHFRSEDYDLIRAELLRLAGEVTELRVVCAATYQAAGCYGLPVRFLDALSNAMHGEKLHKVDLGKLLPVAPVDWVSRAEKTKAELAALKARMFQGVVLDVDSLTRGHAGLPSEWRGKRVRLVVEE